MKELREDLGEKELGVREREERRSMESGGKTNKGKGGKREQELGRREEERKK